MTKIEITGWIHETKFSPDSKPVYSFYNFASTSSPYTVPILAHTIEIEIEERDNSALHVAGFEHAKRAILADGQEKCNALEACKQEWLALPNGVPPAEFDDLPF